MNGMKAWLTRACLVAAALLTSVASADEAVPHDPAPEPARDEAAQEQDSIRDSVQWAESAGRECRRRTQGGRRRWVCDGPLRVPAARGSAAILSEELGLGTRDTARHLLTKPPMEEWVHAVEGPAAETLSWPVAGGVPYGGVVGGKLYGGA